jgi:hypothetical protein
MRGCRVQPDPAPLGGRDLSARASLTSEDKLSLAHFCQRVHACQLADFDLVPVADRDV